MHKLIEKKDTQKLMCLHFFSKNLQYNNSDVPIDVLIDEFGWGKKLALTNLEALRFDIKNNNWDDYLKLTNNSATFNAMITPYFTLDFFVTFYLKKSYTFNLTERLLNQESFDLYSFSDEHFISRSTLYRQLVGLKATLSDFNLDVDFTMNPPGITGEELQIRYFYSLLFADAYHFDIPFTQTVNSEEIDTLLSQLNEIYPNVTLETLLKLRVHLAVCFTRIKQNFVLSTSSVIPQIDSVLFDSAKIATWLRPTLLSFGLSDTQIEYEVRGIFALLVTSNIYSLDAIQEFQPNIATEHIKLSIENNTFIQNFTQYFNLTLTEAELIYLKINLSIIETQAHYFKGSENNARIQVNIAELKQYHPVIYEKCDHFFTHLETTTQRHLTDALRISYLFLFRSLIEKTTFNINICLLTRTHNIQYDYLKTTLESFAPMNISLCRTPDETVDIYVSDFKINQIETQYPQASFFYWSSIPHTHEWLALHKLVHDLIKTKNLQ